MASQPYPLANMPVSAAVDPAFWAQAQDSADSSPLALHLSPSASSTTHESQHSSISPGLTTPKSDNERKNSQTTQQNGQENAQQAAQNGNQARTSVAVACVPCRSRHLKCDGGVRCSRCRADGVDCTYIKSRRGWKGKRKKPGENGAPAVPGLFMVLQLLIPADIKQPKKPTPFRQALCSILTSAPLVFSRCRLNLPLATNWLSQII